MRTITRDEFVEIRSIWYSRKKKVAQSVRYSQAHENWTAVDIIESEDLPWWDKMEIIKKGNLIPLRVWKEWAVWCAKYALSKIEYPDTDVVDLLKATKDVLDGKLSADVLRKKIEFYDEDETGLVSAERSVLMAAHSITEMDSDSEYADTYLDELGIRLVKSMAQYASEYSMSAEAEYNVEHLIIREKNVHIEKLIEMVKNYVD